MTELDEVMVYEDFLKDVRTIEVSHEEDVEEGLETMDIFAAVGHISDDMHNALSGFFSERVFKVPCAWPVGVT